jgi:hypothetical protein
MKTTEKEVRHYLSMCYFQYDENGISPKQAYYLYDTYGKSIIKEFKCSDPVMVQRIIWGKQLTNMTIKMWSDDMKKGLLFKFEIEDDLNSMPAWCRKSLENSLKYKIK